MKTRRPSTGALPSFRSSSALQPSVDVPHRPRPISLRVVGWTKAERSGSLADHVLVHTSAAHAGAVRPSSRASSTGSKERRSPAARRKRRSPFTTTETPGSSVGSGGADGSATLAAALLVGDALAVVRAEPTGVALAGTVVRAVAVAGAVVVAGFVDATAVAGEVTAGCSTVGPPHDASVAHARMTR
ncbi:MAG TPA: hypothetical protein VFV20_10885 [Candidatus Limnocylindria bacterium]|nr:hypothetical protein [Candidatus Limnocylindria bacterium]